MNSASASRLYWSSKPNDDYHPHDNVLFYELIIIRCFPVVLS
jgi:hypothetical protein